MASTPTVTITNILVAILKAHREHPSNHWRAPIETLISSDFDEVNQLSPSCGHL